MAMQDMDLFGPDDFTAFEGGASTHNAFASAFSSPAVTPYDMNANLSSSSINMGTISPQDLQRRDTFSAPNSTSFTNLTSPSTYNESPDYTEDFDVSPFIGGGELDSALAADPWFPLFPQEELAEQQQRQQQTVEQSPLLPEEELELADTLRSRRRPTTSSSSPGAHSSVSGVNAKKRDKPLPPIIVEDPNDTVAMKRARNTLAARKSRQRKMQRFEDLEDEIEKLKADRDHWKSVALRRGGGTQG